VKTKLIFFIELVKEIFLKIMSFL